MSAREPSRLTWTPFSKSSSASPDTTAARWKITSGRPAMAARAAAASAISAALVVTVPVKPCGFCGALTSISVSFSIGLPLSAPAATSRATSLRPIIPAAPVMRMCMGYRPPVTLQRHPAVDEMRLAGNVARLVAGKKEGEQSHFLGRAEPTHRLAIDESLTNHVERFSSLLRQRGNALFQRRRFDRAGTDGVAADSLLDEISGDRLGQPDHRRLGRAIGVTIWYAADRRHRRGDVDDRAVFFLLQHRRQECLDHAMHGFDVQIERKIPILIRAIEDRALVHVAGAIDQDIERAEFARNVCGERIDIVLRAHVELEGFLGLEPVKLVVGDVSRDDGGTLLDESFGDGAANALAGGGHQRDFILQSITHAHLAFLAFTLLYSTP